MTESRLAGALLTLSSHDAHAGCRAKSGRFTMKWLLDEVSDLD